MTGPTDAAVVAEGLEKSFGTTRALAGVDLTVERAKVVALLGPNGAGKTTAVRAITTLIKPDRGACSSTASTCRPTRCGPSRASASPASTRPSTSA